MANEARVVREKISIGEIGKTQCGGTPSSKRPEFFQGTIPWIGTTALNGKRIDESDAIKMITEDAVSNSSTKLVPANSIMVGIRVGVGKVAINSVPMCTSQDIVSIVGVDDSIWNKEYIALALKFFAPTLAAQAQGATIVGISSKTLKAITIPAASRNKQDEIVDQLRSIEKQIDIAYRQIERLDALVKSRFVEMFGNPCNSDLWPMSSLGALYDVRSSKRIYAKEQTNEGVPFYRLADIGNLIDGKRVDSGLCISCEGFKELANSGYVPKKEDILITARGTLGRCYVIKEDDRFYFQDGMITWLARTEASPVSDYLIQVFRNDEFLSELNDSCSGTTVKYLSISDLAKVNIPLPPIELQKQFVSVVKQVDKSKSIAQRQIEKLQMLYDSLAQEYFGD